MSTWNIIVWAWFFIVFLIKSIKTVTIIDAGAIKQGNLMEQMLIQGAKMKQKCKHRYQVPFSVEACNGVFST